jgi:hypothetical protein
MGYMMRKKLTHGRTAQSPDGRVVKVHEAAGCEENYLHTPGGVELERDGQTVFATPEEAAEDDLQGDDAGGARGV